MGATCAVIPAAGRGERFRDGSGHRTSKVLAPLAGRPVLAHTLGAFQASTEVDAIVVVASASLRPAVRRLVATFECHKVCAITLGGETRQESVAAGLRALPVECDVVLVHDAARPLLSDALIGRCVRAARRHGAAMPALPVVDTLVTVGTDGECQPGPDRSHLRTVQTPQAFRVDWIREAHAAAAHDCVLATDDASLVHRLGRPVYLVAGERANLKITLSADLQTAEAFLQARRPAGPDIRVGTGYDVHQLAPGCDLWLGGVLIPHDRGLVGHSDADVALHALMDALLGAAGLPDIGHLFPNTDPSLRGASSLVLLGRVVRALSERSFSIVNADLTILAERPKVGPYILAMREKIAVVLGVEPERVGLKATTHEGVGAIGRHEAIAANAVVLVQKA